MRRKGEEPWDDYDGFEGDVESIIELDNAGEILEAVFGNRLGVYVHGDGGY